MLSSSSCAIATSKQYRTFVLPRCVTVQRELSRLARTACRPPELLEHPLAEEFALEAATGCNTPRARATAAAAAAEAAAVAVARLARNGCGGVRRGGRMPAGGQHDRPRVVRHTEGRGVDGTCACGGHGKDWTGGCSDSESSAQRLCTCMSSPVGQPLLPALA